MKKFSKNDKDLAKVFIAVTAAVLLCLAAWLFFEKQAALLRESYMDAAAGDNEYTATVMADHIASSASDADEAAAILSSASEKGTRYWFLLSPESLVFERDSETTAATAGKSYSELEDYYIRRGGTGVKELFALIQTGRPFSAVVLKESSRGSELISTAFADIGGEQYCVGLGVSQSYIYSAGKIGERIQFLRIMTMLLCAAVTALTAVFCITAQRKSQRVRILRSDLADKNVLVQEQSERLIEADSDTPGKCEDTLTGLYNRKFYDAVLTKLSERQTEDIGIIYIRISNMAPLYYEKGFSFTNKLITDTAGLFRSNASDQDICARISKNEFAMIKLNTTNAVTLQAVKKLAGELREQYPDADYAEGFSFKRKDMTLEAAVKAAHASL